MIGTLHDIVIDCPEPDLLATSRILVDPVGHPLCLVKMADLAETP